MSELKTIKHIDVLWGHWFTEYYIKKQADKVICKAKYKRCKAMAKYCDAAMSYFGEYHDDASNRMVCFFYRWRSRWYELAEKFKEADK